ncbi:cation:proton antiporter [Streptomyces tendae]|uniref:cation:proton antiporter n=1 Tax=Streptomyces tendae TaxID=1932 RepID=UPI0037215E63
MQTAAALSAVLVLALLGRAGARLLRQPEVVGEVVAGLLAGPAVLALLGRDGFDAVLPGRVLNTLEHVAQAALVLFLVGLAHELGGNGQPKDTGSAADGQGVTRRAVTRVAVGSLVPTSLVGVLLTGWVVAYEDDAVRGDAPVAALTLMMAGVMSVTAVPVLARMLTDLGISQAPAGRLALAAALVIDLACWLLLTGAVALGSGSTAGVLHAGAALALGGVGALCLRQGLRTHVASLLLRRVPSLATGLLAASALLIAFTMEELGMTAILGAALVGFAIPGDRSSPWAPAVTRISRTGRFFVPVFFVVAGVTVLSDASMAVSWTLIGLVLVLGTLGKVLGGYAGTRSAGGDRVESARVAVLLNTRGLTELVIIQAGFSAGLLTPPLVLALIVMTLVGTAATGPLMRLLDRTAPPAAAPAPAGPATPATASVPLPTESGVR